MTVWIGPAADHGIKLHGRPVLACKMIAHSRQELETMARELNVPREWIRDEFTDPHYVLIGRIGKRALSMGAQDGATHRKLYEEAQANNERMAALCDPLATETCPACYGRGKDDPGYGSNWGNRKPVRCGPCRGSGRVRPKATGERS